MERVLDHSAFPNLRCPIPCLWITAGCPGWASLPHMLEGHLPGGHCVLSPCPGLLPVAALGVQALAGHVGKGTGCSEELAHLTHDVFPSLKLSFPQGKLYFCMNKMSSLNELEAEKEGWLFPHPVPTTEARRSSLAFDGQHGHPPLSLICPPCPLVCSFGRIEAWVDTLLCSGAVAGNVGPWWSQVPALAPRETRAYQSVCLSRAGTGALRGRLPAWMTVEIQGRKACRVDWWPALATLAVGGLQQIARFPTPDSAQEDSLLNDRKVGSEDRVVPCTIHCSPAPPPALGKAVVSRVASSMVALVSLSGLG